MSSLAFFKLIMRGEDPKIQIPLKVGHHRSAIWRFADGLVAFRFSGDPDQPIALRFFMGGPDPLPPLEPLYLLLKIIG